MNTPQKLVTCLALATLAMGSCKKDKDSTSAVVAESDYTILSKTLNLPEALFNYAKPELPFYFRQDPVAPADNNNVDNPITDAGATLGRVLFYDKMLSINNNIACASCHSQANSFSDPKQFSEGFAGGFTTRNSMSLANARYYNNGKFFWDERANTLEDQTLMPIQHEVEMGMTLDSLEKKLAVKDYYKILFRKAFGDEAVTRDRISKSLAQFIRSMVSYQSRYDEGIVALGHVPAPGEVLPNFTQQEVNGMRLYQQNCGRCHGTEVQIMNQAANNGLDMVYTDNGLGDITRRATDNGKFKVPSLRNVALTAPYMHDGRFKTLAEVIEHYNTGVKNHPNLDPRLKTPGGTDVLRPNLNDQQKNAIIAFLNTLTDSKFTSEVKYANPFK